ncbi:MAG: hypothetical protein K6G69_01440 [Lachnospiraceae bacterium]|nr:hypothetical protein [Lachnospiraceae bacterium]
MKYAKEMEFDEILKRGNIVKQKHVKKMIKIYSCATLVLSFALIGLFGIFVRSGAVSNDTTYGSFILPVETGGYILLFILAFGLGVIVTLFLKKHRDKEYEDEDKIVDNDN